MEYVSDYEIEKLRIVLSKAAEKLSHKLNSEIAKIREIKARIEKEDER